MNKKKRLFFVSTGRCGTKRLAEILDKKLPKEKFSVKHQMDISRFANVTGNLMYYFGDWEWLKQKIYNHIIKKYANNKNFICSDPLISMILPRKIINDSDTYIVHIIREKESFASSFFRFTRKRFLSFVAHNFIPFWQIGILPLENIFNNRIEDKYKNIWDKKNLWLKNNYHKSVNYFKCKMSKIFYPDTLNSLINNIFDEDIEIKNEELDIKANES